MSIRLGTKTRGVQFSSTTPCAASSAIAIRFNPSPACWFVWLHATYVPYYYPFKTKMYYTHSVSIKQNVRIYISFFRLSSPPKPLVSHNWYNNNNTDGRRTKSFPIPFLSLSSLCVLLIGQKKRISFSRALCKYYTQDKRRCLCVWTGEFVHTLSRVRYFLLVFFFEKGVRNEPTQLKTKGARNPRRTETSQPLHTTNYRIIHLYLYLSLHSYELSWN